MQKCHKPQCPKGAWRWMYRAGGWVCQEHAAEKPASKSEAK